MTALINKVLTKMEFCVKNLPNDEIVDMNVDSDVDIHCRCDAHGAKRKQIIVTRLCPLHRSRPRARRGKHRWLMAQLSMNNVACPSEENCIREIHEINCLFTHKSRSKHPDICRRLVICLRTNGSGSSNRSKNWRGRLGMQAGNETWPCATCSDKSPSEYGCSDAITIKKQIPKDHKSACRPYARVGVFDWTISGAI